MTFTVTDSISTYTLDIETLDELFTLGYERYADCQMMIDWAAMAITITPME